MGLRRQKARRHICYWPFTAQVQEPEWPSIYFSANQYHYT